MRSRGVLLLAVATLAISSLVSTAWAAGLTITSKPVGSDFQAKPTFYPRSIATATCTDLLVCTFGGIAGTPNNGDTVTLSFNTVLNQGTLCSAWAGGNTTNRSATVTATISNNAGTTGNDTLTITAVSGITCTGGMKFGTVDLGSAGYVGGNISYTSTSFTLSNAGTTPTIALKFGGGSTGTNVASSTITYRCDAALESSTNVECGTNRSVSGAVQQF